MRNVRAASVCGVFCWIAGLACGGRDVVCVSNDEGGLDCTSSDAEGDGIPGAEASLQQRLEALDFDLAGGSKGNGVAAVQAYLTKFGYFPSDELETLYPDWRPVVNRAPELGLFDEPTRQAVRALQALSGLPSTGVVDEPTRQLLRATRCGNPDQLPPGSELGEAEKYSITFSGNPPVPFKFPAGTQIKYAATNTDDGIAPFVVQNAVGNVLGIWAAESQISFAPASGSPANITVSFGALDGVGGLYGQQSGTSQSRTIVFDDTEDWTMGTPTGTERNLTTALMHEIGHALGLGHSSIPGATMDGTTDNLLLDTTLSTDDKVGISALYDVLEQVPGTARDIGVSAGGEWIVTRTAVGDNFTIQKRVNGTFQTTNNGSARRISVAPNGRPWVIANDGSIWRRTTLLHDSGTWEQIAGPNAAGAAMGCATDIGVGGAGASGEGTVWALGCTSVSGGFRIFKRVDGVFVQTNNGAAVRIDVSETGVPWVVASNNTIHYRTSGGQPSGNHLAPATWTQTADGLAADVGVSSTNYPWVLGNDGTVWVWNQQGPETDPNADPDAPELNTWRQISGSQGVAIDSGPGNTPWLVTTNGSIWRPAK